MPNPRVTTQDWFYHPPSKRQERPAVEPPAPSQIPGLSNVDDIPDDTDERHFRRKWIHETDSDYIKLAKGGGRKDLFRYREAKVSEEPVSYYRPDWIDNVHGEEEERGPPVEQIFLTSKRRQPKSEGYRVLPEWYVHEHSSNNLQTQQPAMQAQAAADHTKKRRPMISFDNMTAWERQAMEENEFSRKAKLPPIAKKKAPKSLPKETVPTTRAFVKKLPAIETDVNLFHLLSSGYGKDWFDTQRSKDGHERERRKTERQKQEEKHATQMRDAAQMRKPKTIATEEDKPIFKLHRFERVGPRVESFRT